jgi:hypothetical protein
MSPLIPVLVGLVVILGCLAGGFNVLRKKRTIDDLPTSKTQGVFIGMSEVKGTAESDHPFTGYLSGTRCVYYVWKVEEEWRRTVTETYTDSKGHTHTRTRTESGWKVVADGGESAPFYLKDDTGVIRIVPEGAKINDDETFSRSVSPGDPLYFGKGPAVSIAHSTHHRRFSERALPLHCQLYVIGQAREREDVVAAEIASDKRAVLFIISTKSEKQISQGYAAWFWVWTVLGLLCAFASGLWWGVTLANGNSSGWAYPVIMIAIFIVLLVLVYFWTTYNNLINLYQRVQQGWSQVDVQIKRRFDLIPNLVKVVEGYQQYEKGVQSTLATLRSQMTATPQGVDGPDYQGLSITLNILAEKYPDLKAAENFLSLQRALSDCEQRVALARDYFNQVTTFYNNRLEIIPERYVAALARLKPRLWMSAADFERAPVEVKLE